MADWHAFGEKSMRDEDFDEEDVWGVVKERDDSSSKMRKSKEFSGSSSAWSFPTAPRMIPRANIQPTSHEAKVVQQSSAPVDIPDWSKIYGRHAKKGLEDGSWVADENTISNGPTTLYDDGGGGDDEDNMVPPHEWIARKLAMSQISSFSVCEGIGRTLKGRDLSKVRDAVLTKTGFLE
ncbi:Senescence regulator [Quillaja saponaria]|uniref:Senescence regulator n=1 Tax=Quillaja saponaria TaxID=32244 RepID=A0AAD7KV14_QUISA|nr:Senescence regulator [Quillaja saponaria]